jgi:hypothetical protein
MAKKLSKTAQVTAYIKSNPTAATGYLAEKFGVKSAYISSLKWKLKKEGVAIPKTRKVLGVTMGVGDFEKLTDEQLLRVVDGYRKPKHRMLSASTANKSIMEHIAPHIPVYEDSVEHITPKRLAEITFELTRGRPAIMEIEPPADPVNHPAHYKAGGIETIDFIEAKKLGYNLGNVVKYITRADLKGNRTQDLEKALWYLKREIGAQ